MAAAEPGDIGGWMPVDAEAFVEAEPYAETPHPAVEPEGSLSDGDAHRSGPPSSAHTRGLTLRRLPDTRDWTVRRFDLASVARFSAVFYLTVLAVCLMAGTVLWALASVAGLVGSAERFVKSLFGFTSFHFQPGRIFLGALLIGAVLTLLGTLCNVVGAAVYNLIAGMVGGVRVTVSEGASVPGPRPPAGGTYPPRPVI